MLASIFHSLRVGRAYVCRGCGTEITSPESFKKCPVCGITYNG